MTSRGSAVKRLTLEALKLSVLKSVEDMIMNFVEKLGCDCEVKSVNFEDAGENRRRRRSKKKQKKEDYCGV